MYAVIQTGGKQYRVSPGQTVRVEKLQGDPGAAVILDSVLMYANNDDIKIGQPALSDVKVRGHIVEQGKAKKIIVFKMKRRKRYRRKQGHRQLYTAIKIDDIETSLDSVETSIDNVETTSDSVETSVENTETPSEQ
jgi:large subunit ribosomal protein L21